MVVIVFAGLELQDLPLELLGNLGELTRGHINKAEDLEVRPCSRSSAHARE